MGKKKYNRKFLKKHFDTNIYVSIDGEHAERDIQIKKTGQDTVFNYDIYREECGRAFIVDKYKGNLYLDELVLTCYRGNPPKTGKKYFPYHKNGDMSDSNASNLEWKEETAATIGAYRKLEREAWCKNCKIMVLQDGTIMQDGQVLNKIGQIDDADMGWIYHKPYHWIKYRIKNHWENYDDKSINVDEIFDDLGFIDDYRSEFSNPVILHRNNNYEDYSMGNLEWCDASDDRYKTFDKIRHDAVMEKDRKSNHPVNERDWNAIYNGKEPYRDWGYSADNSSDIDNKDA